MAAGKRAGHWLELDGDVYAPERIQIYGSGYLSKVHTLSFYCRLNASWIRAVLRKKNAKWIGPIWVLSMKLNIGYRKKNQFVLLATSDSYCFIPSLLRTEGGGAKPEHNQDGHHRWDVRQSCSALSFYRFCKEENYLSFVRSRRSDCPHWRAPSTCVRRAFHSSWRSLRKFVFEQSRLN